MISGNEFKKIGGEFMAPISQLKSKAGKIKAFVFDWDGVFNDSRKSGKGESYFTEVDSMGTNLMRFGNWLRNQERMPYSGVISGELSDSAIQFIEREHFNYGYFKAKDKIEAWKDFLIKTKLQPKEVAFFFDDVLDLPVAKECGLRFCMRRTSNPVLNAYLRKNNLADYLTGNLSGNFALREACELMMFLQNNATKVLDERVSYSKTYSRFITIRNSIRTQIFNKAQH